MAENVGSSDIWSDGVEKIENCRTQTRPLTLLLQRLPTRKGGFYHEEDDHQKVDHPKACFCYKEIHGKESFYHKEGYF